MPQLIRADLIGILTLFADYRPQLDLDSLALDIRKLERQENSWEPEDYIAAPLFPVSEITPDGLAERIREADAAYKAWVEAEDAAAQEAENAEKGTT